MSKRKLREELEKQKRLHIVMMSAMTDLCRDRERMLRKEETLAIESSILIMRQGRYGTRDQADETDSV